MMIRIDVSNDPDQLFSISLGNRRVSMRLRYNAFIDRWCFDLALDDLPILHGRRIVTGIDLLAPFNLGIGVIFAASLNSDLPTRSNLPAGNVRLYQVNQAELDAAISS